MDARGRWERAHRAADDPRQSRDSDSPVRRRAELTATWSIPSLPEFDGTRTVIMGIVNVTPDSFSDGGNFPDPETAVAHGVRLSTEGADLVDVGGESTRPGSKPVALGEELDRVLPVIKGLVASGVAVSVDTSKPEVAEEALAEGASVLNDVTALSDPRMTKLAAESGCALVLMHMQGRPETMQDDPRYGAVVAEVRDYLLERAQLAITAGVDATRVAIDPGFGFGKKLDHNLELLRNLDEFVATGFPVLIGTSRKGFLGKIGGVNRPEQRDSATAATITLAIAAKVSAVRVHNVAMAAQIARITDAIVRATE